MQAFEMQVEQKICNAVQSILTDLLSDKNPTIHVVEVGGKCRTISLGTPKTLRIFTIQTRLIVYILGLLKSNKRVTKREVFYQFEALFRTQGTLDDALDRIARTLKVPRNALHIDAAGKGLFYGSIMLNGDINECLSPRTIPTDLVEVESAEGFVLVVEKEAIFQVIVEDYEYLKGKLGPFIVVTGKGYPCMATRRLVAVLGEQRKLPVMVLVDFDPYGIEIALQYKIGSKKLPDDIDDLKCPSIQYLGICRSDLDAHSTHFDTFPLTSAERKRIKKLKIAVQSLGWSGVARELAFMLDHDCKAEIEAIKKVGDHHYFTRGYLVTKIRQHLSLS